MRDELQAEMDRELSSKELDLISQGFENYKTAVPVAKVVNDNQPGKTAIVEILCDPATLGVGTELYIKPVLVQSDHESVTVEHIASLLYEAANPTMSWSYLYPSHSHLHAAVRQRYIDAAARFQDRRAEPFPQPKRKDGGEPCGECHIRPGETCDICGASNQPPAPNSRGQNLTDFRKFVGLIEGRAMACDGPVTPFLEELHVASDAEKLRFTEILRKLYASSEDRT